MSRFKTITGILVALTLLSVGVLDVYAQPGPTAFIGTPDPSRPSGITINTGEAQPGYILIPILQSKKTWLLSNDGRIVKVWDGDYYSAYSTYLEPDGDLVRAVALPPAPFGPVGPWSYIGGRIEQLNWNGDLVATADYTSDRLVQHHSIDVMPNGHVLLLVYDRHLKDEALAVGRKLDLIPEDNEVWGENIVEMDLTTGEVVWEWSVWDHLIQDVDAALPGYGVVADHPEKININYNEVDLTSDWLHGNAVEYNPDRDQIAISLKNSSEIWIIDHSIPTEEAKGADGDLRYRWGNPEAYDAGTDADQILYGQHDPEWIPQGYPGAGNITIFDNGSQDERPYSRIVEIAVPTDHEGYYIMEPGKPTGPAEPVWEYVADPPESFFSPIISSAQRQPNGNTLITEGTKGRLFEVTPAGKIVWEYYLPPAAIPFRSGRYALDATDAIFSGFDQGQDLSAELGFNIIWGGKCVDDTQPRLHAYLQNEADDMKLFNDTYGDQAQQEWEIKSCKEHGGLVTAS